MAAMPLLSTRTALAIWGRTIYVPRTHRTQNSLRLAWRGRLSLTVQLRTWVTGSLQALHAETLAISHEIALAAYELPGEFHRDPADRMLVATAVVHDLALITADERILAYPHLLSYDVRA